MGKTTHIEGPSWFSETAADIEGHKCLNGAGPVPARVVFVDKCPSEREVWSKRPYSDRARQFLFAKMKEAGWTPQEIKACRFTYATHHCPKKYSADEVNWGKRMFQEELASVNPEVVVCLGADPLKQVVGTAYRWDDVHGAFIRPDNMDSLFDVFATFNLEQVMFGPKWDRHLLRDLEWVRRRMNGDDIPTPKCDHAVVRLPEHVKSFVDWALSWKEPKFVALDFETRSIPA